MTRATEAYLYRMRQCEVDLMRNGIDLAGAGARELRLLVRRHLDYFQLMLGYDASPAEIVELAGRLRQLRDGPAPRGRGARPAGRRATAGGAAPRRAAVQKTRCSTGTPSASHTPYGVR